MKSTSTAGVVLAAGSSARLGRNKLLLDLGSETVVRRTVRAAVEGGLAPVIVILGHEADRVKAELDGLSCSTVFNPDHARGVGTSLQAGVTHVADAGALVLILADMPFVTSQMIATVVERYEATGAPLVVSRYGDVFAPPNLFDQCLFAELLDGDPKQCGKRVVLDHQQEAVILTWPEAALQDIDVAQDYDRVRAQLGAR